jgi:hypothetical protein
MGEYYNSNTMEVDISETTEVSLDSLSLLLHFFHVQVLHYTTILRSPIPIELIRIVSSRFETGLKVANPGTIILYEYCVVQISCVFMCFEHNTFFTNRMLGTRVRLTITHL